jgi:hypothetical protein
MSLPVFPALAGITFPSLKTSEFNTLIQDSPNKMDTRISQTRNPYWHWEAVLDFVDDTPSLTPTEADILRGFQLTLGGSAGDFLYTDPTDNAVGPALISGPAPNPNAELALVTDGTNYFSPIQRNMGGFLEDITDLNGAIVVYANGVLATVGSGAGQYQVMGPGLSVSGSSFMGLYLAWGGGVSPTGPISVQFSFYFRCRLESDSMDFEQFASQIWTLGGSSSRLGSESLKFCSSRIPQV